MTTDKEVEEFLEHHGVKGMKWGVRNRAASKNRPTSKRKERNKAVLKSVGRISAGTAISAGTLFAIAWLANNKSIKNQGENVVTTAKKLQGKAFLDASRDRIFQDVATKQAKLLKDINADYRKHYDLVQTPFKQREFFDPSPWEKKINK
jgi:hypothetical protein